MTLTHKFIPLITELLVVFFMDLVIPIKQWTIVGNLNDLQILQDWTRETWKLISKCVWTEVGWSNQTNVDKISAPSQEGTISISKWLQIKFRYLHPWVTFPFGFYRNSKEIYWSQIEPVWHDIISSPPEYISLSHSFRKKRRRKKFQIGPKNTPWSVIHEFKAQLANKEDDPHLFRW